MRLQRTLQGLVTVICLTVITVGAGIYLLLDHLNNRLTEQGIQLQASQQVADIRTQLVQYRSQVQHYAHLMPAKAIANDPARRAYLNSICPSDNGCNAYMFDRRGSVLGTSQLSYSSSSLNDTHRHFFTETFSGGQSTLAVVDSVTRTGRVYLSERLDSSGGVPLGVLVIAFNISELAGSLGQLNSPAVLLSAEGQVLYSNKPAWLGLQLTATSSSGSSLGLVQDNATHAHIGERDYRLASILLDNTPGWQLVVLEPVSGPAALVVSLPVWIGASMLLSLLLLAVGFLLNNARREAQLLSAEAAVHQQAAEQRQALMDLSETPVLTVQGQHLLEVNQAGLELLGLHRDQLGAARLSDFLQLPQQTVPNKPLEIIGRRSNGADLALEVICQPGQQGVDRLRIRDLAQQKAAERYARYKAHYDGLTGLANRNLLQEQLNQQLERARQEELSLYLLFIDLDDFKKVNDSRGHNIGDQLLIMAAQRLQQACSDNMTLARYGGDEFVILMQPGMQERQVKAVAAQVNQTLAQVFQIQHSRYFISASIGLASYPADAADAGELLQKADTAMYCAKAEGGNTYCQYSPAMNRDINQRLAIEQQLRGALENRELKLVYQPLLSARHQELKGAEALLRWENPELGVVPPDIFIPLAEQTGLIESIGHWVLHEVVRQVDEWQQQGLGTLNVSVNVSPRQFRDQAIMRSVEAVLAKFSVPPSAITLEVTEGLLMRRATDTAATLHSLKRLGVKLSMDDFGTGYSSLSYLKRYPFDSLKIDREFVRDINTDKSDRQLITAALSMARALGMRVVAEGIENEEQLTFLDQAGCDLVQGYLLGRPVPANTFAEKYFNKLLVNT